MISCMLFWCQLILISRKKLGFRIILFLMLLKELEEKLFSLLKINDFPQDPSLNGVQVGDKNKEIKKICFAVDACQESIDRAIDAKADMLFVHHGLFWGSPIAITDTHYKRVKKLLDNDCALFACHLPLDAHSVLGNNAQIAKILGMKSYDPFCMYKGSYIGFKGELPFPMSTEQIEKLLGFSVMYGLNVLPFGKDSDHIKTVGIVSGGAGDDVYQAIEEGLDCYITGEVPHEIFHISKESEINVIGGGHYQSEVFGVKAVARYLSGEMGLETEFIDIRTAL